MRRTDDETRLAMRTSKQGIQLTINNWVVSIVPAIPDGYESPLSVAIWDLTGKELDVTGYGAFTLDNAIRLERVLQTVRMYGVKDTSGELLAGFIRSILGMTAQEYEDHKTGRINDDQPSTPDTGLGMGVVYDDLGD